MKMIKRWLSFLLVALMVLTSIPADTFAADTDAGVKPTISIESTNAQPGDTVTLNVTIKNNPGILGATLGVTFDEGLTLESAEAGKAFSYLMMTQPGKMTSPCNFSWDGEDISETDVVEDGTILSLTFKVNEDASTGDYKVSLSAGDFVDKDFNTLSVDVNDGKINVLDYTPGDVNDDGKINVSDVVLTRRHIVGGYDISINQRAANINGDQKINTVDVIYLRRYIAGGYNIVPLASEPICNHTLEATEYKAATCTENGNTAYWHCTTCGKYFSDELTNHEITLEDTVIEAVGHTPVTDPAVEPTATEPGLTEGSHCSVCGTVLVEQKEWTLNTYTIKYDIANGDSYLTEKLSKLEITNDPENKEIIEEGGSFYLQDINVEGYQFLGWYDGAGDDAAKVTKIENADHNMILYAHWNKNSYSIQFKSDLIPVDEMTYTSNTGKILPTPSLDGYTFAGWSDFEGNNYKKIDKGTSGNIVLYANWVSDRNQAWAKKELDDPIVYEDEDNHMILFTYEIGDIKNVPVYELHNFGKVLSNGVSKTATETYSVTTSESLMDSYVKNVQKATTDSSSWTLSNDWTDSVSVSEEYCNENKFSQEEAESVCKSDTGSWYVSNSSGGSHTQNTVDSTDTYDLITENNNTKSWSDDYAEEFDKGKVTTTYNLTDHTYGYDVSGKYTSNASINASVDGIGLSASKNLEIDGSYEDKTNKKNEKTTTKYGTDTTTIKGEAYDNTTTTNTGTVSNHTSNTTDYSTWNTEEGYSASNTTSESQSIRTAISQLTSEKTGYGKSYINSSGESSTQGTTNSASSSDEYASSVTYSTVTSKEVTETYSTSNTVTGYHRWVMAGTAHVFAIVGYDMTTKSYFVKTFSVMDDDYYPFEDYSYNSGSYDDNQSSVIPFEVPDDIVDYITARTFSTDGLEFDTDGTVTAYNGSDSLVVIPDYARIDNKDDTYNIVKVTKLAEGVFTGKNITGIKLSRYIDEIPNNAFKNCEKLWDVCSYATSIGDYAFSGCKFMSDNSLSSAIRHIGENAFKGSEYLTVNAKNKNLVEQALAAGAKNVTIGTSKLEDTLDDVTLKVSSDIDAFTLKGYDKVSNNLVIDSEAKETILNRVNINSDKSIPLQMSSSKVGLYQLTINSPGVCMTMVSDSTDVDLYGQVYLNSENENAILCRNAVLEQNNQGLATKLNLKGNLVTCGTISGKEYLNSGAVIKTVSEETFENMLHSYTLKYDANGGTCSDTEKEVANNTAVGELPEATRDGYTFEGWYTKADGGEKVTETSVFTTAGDLTVYAHWTLVSININLDANGGTLQNDMSTSQITGYWGKAIGELPTPTRDYYTFKGWYNGSDLVTEDTKVTTAEDMNLQAKWEQNALSDWVLESEVPDDAEIVNQKWTYRSYKTSSNSTESGWTKDETKTKRTGWGAKQGPVYSDPSNGSRNVMSESYVVSSNYKTVYHYYRYASVNADTGGSGAAEPPQAGDECIYYREIAVDSPLAQGTSKYGGTIYWYYSNWYWYKNTTSEWVSDNYGTRWYYQEPVYTYYYYQDNTDTSETKPSGDNISDVKKWVQYREK